MRRADTTSRHYAGDSHGGNSDNHDGRSSNPGPDDKDARAIPDEAPVGIRPNVHVAARHASGHPEPAEHSRCSPQAQQA